MPDESQRLYSEKEIHRILRRASAIQEQAMPEATGTGLTLEELQHIAAEAGIDPRFIALAVREESNLGEHAPKTFHWLGAPISTIEERTVQGVLTETELEDVMAEMRRTFGKAGTVSRVGGTLEWTHSDRNNQIQVTITSREGLTTLRVFERFVRPAILIYSVPLALVFQVAIVAQGLLGLEALVGWVLVLGLLAATGMASRFAFKRLVHRKKRRANDLLDRLVKTTSLGSESFPEAETTARLEGIESHDQDAEAASIEQATRRRTSSRS